MLAKRKRVVVTLEQKLKAVKRVKNGETLRVVAADFGVGRSTVADWLRTKDKMEEHSSKLPNRKTMKPCRYEKVNEATFLWFTQQRGTPLPGPIIQEKARILSEKIGNVRFTASSGWLEKWKTRYGVRQSKATGENDPEATDVFINDFKSSFQYLSQSYTKDQIFSVDEIKLCYKMLPKKYYESEQDSKMNKQRISMLACSNASGTHCLPLMCIGTSKKSRALKTVASNALPVFYRHQKYAWMTCELFKDWFHSKFVPNVDLFLKSKNLPRQAILLIDNAISHSANLQNGDIILKLLPSIVANSVQPMKQGVSKCFKMNYCQLVLRHLLQYDNRLKSVEETLEAIQVNDVVYWCAQAWQQLKQSTLVNCWNQLYDDVECSEENESHENLQVLLEQIPGCENVDENDIIEWINSDDLELDYTDQEIVDLVMQSDEMDVNGADEEGDGQDNNGFNTLGIYPASGSEYYPVSKFETHFDPLEDSVSAIDEDENPSTPSKLSLERDVIDNRYCKEPCVSEPFNIFETADKKDECALFGDYIAEKLRKMDDRTCAVVQHQINNLIFEAEMEAFNKTNQVLMQPSKIEPVEFL